MKPKIKKLKNGLQILSVPMAEQRTAMVLILVETGSKYETKDKNGIAHFLEHMCFKGTTNRPTAAIISTELDGLGAEYNAFTGHEYTGYYAKVAAAHLPQALDLVADIYCNPLFNVEDIEREKGVIADEINMYEDMPMRKVGDLFMKLVYGDQPAGWEIAGSKELIRTFTQKDFLAYRAAQYVPAATMIVVAGKFNEKEIEKLINKKFDGLIAGKKKGKLKTKDTQQKPMVVTQFKESDQTHLVLGVRSFPLNHNFSAALSVLAAVLGGGMSSRLFQKIRTQMGLGYYVWASNDAFTDHGIFKLSAGVGNDRAPEAITAMLAELTRLKFELISDEELKKAKDMLAGRLLLGLESSDELGEFYGFQQVLKKKMLSPEEVIAQMNKVTSKELRVLAQRIFITKHLNLAVIGPWKNAAPFRKLLKL